MMIIMFIFTALRDGIGVDTLTYQEIFKTISNNEIDGLYIESGYIYLNKFVSIFSNSYVLVQILTTGICLYFTYRFISDNIQIKYHGIAFIVLLCSTLYLSYYCSGVRQGIATSICLFSTKQIINRRFIKFIILIIIASLFHKSALIFLPAYFVYKKKMSTKHLILLLILSYISAPLIKQIFDIAIMQVTGHYMGYATMFNEGANSKTGIGVIIRMTFWLTILFLAHYGTSNNSTNKNILINLFVVGICLYLMFRYVDILNRFNDYYLSYVIVVFTFAVESFNKPSRKFFYIYSFLILIALFISFVLFANESFIPYKSYLN